MTRLKVLRVFTIAVLALIALQFELGMNVNMSPNLHEVTPLAFSVAAILAALHSISAIATTHAIVGTFLVLATLITLLISVASRQRSIIVIGILCFITTATAAYTGVLFTLSGFRNDGFSYGMSTNFLLTFALHFVQVCILSVKIHKFPVSQ